jgi:small subunit ribosomal protein S8
MPSKEKLWESKNHHGNIIFKFMTTIPSDPIADLLTRIRNAAMARKDMVVVPYTRQKMDILKVLRSRKFISDFQKEKKGDFEEIEIVLAQEKAGITLTRISKPGQRIYIKSVNLRKVNGGLGVAILSTPKGIMSGEEAIKAKVGGELLCEVY